MTPRAIVATIAFFLLACVGGGVLADRWTRTHASPEARAEALEHAGTLDGAERMYWALLQQGPVTVPLLVGFLDVHVRGLTFQKAPALADDPHSLRIAPRSASIDEASIDALLARQDIPPMVTLLGRYWRGYLRESIDPGVVLQVVRAADADPPAPWANHLLAEAAHDAGRFDEEAARFLREGTFFHERASDVNRALAFWDEVDAWDRIDAALADPRIATIAQPWFRLRSAIRRHDWLTALRVFPRCVRSPISLGTGTLAAIAALVWGTFLARLGHVGARPGFRIPLYFAAFVLGVGSIAMTLALVALEETILKMDEVGNPLRDLLYYTFGVGFREEASKLLFFAPLLPLLRRKGTRLDVLVCGGFVGLGFASEENLGYLSNGDLSTAMARFLTANFLHISMTAILAGALHEMLRDGEEGSLRFSLALLKVAALHGVYDFCISSHIFKNLSYFSMAIFFLLARLFLTEVQWSRAAERAAPPYLLETFTLGMALVTGASFVYASALVGPRAAAAALAEGLVGLGIVVILFVQELRRV